MAEFALGVGAALVTPFHLRGTRLNGLREHLDGARSVSGRVDPEIVARIAVGATQRLARLPLPVWRNTCLYRSVAESLALRWSGVDARVMIGVRNANPPLGRIEAHAWVVRGDGPEGHAGYQPLSSSRQPIPLHARFS